MDKGRFLRVPEQLNDGTMDKYTAAIELSNACRQFYQARVEAANCIKSRWQTHASSARFNDNERRSNDNGNCRTTNTQQRHRNSIDEAMEKLRTEMTSLMDQDLSLMRQLLTLNETIEDLKWQRRYYYSRSSLRGSSADLAASGSSLSDMTDSEEEGTEEGRLGQGELRLSEHHHHHHHPHRSQPCRHDQHHLPHHQRAHNCVVSSVPAVSIAPSPTCPVPCVVLCPPHSPSSSSSSFSSSTKSTTSFSSASSSTSSWSSKLKRGPVVTSPCHLASAAAHADGKSARGSGKAYHSEQDSLDSGIHETFSSSSGEEEAVV